jgi:flagellar hook-associated protein 3 FlgL
MRITQKIMASNSLYYLQQQQQGLNKLQEQLSSESNINRPSDDPVNTRLLLSIGDQLKANSQYNANITQATTSLQMSTTALQGMSDAMQQAKSLIDSIATGSTDTTVISSVVSQLKALKQNIVDYGNIQLGNQYLFGGANNSTPPFTSPTTYDGTSNSYGGDGTAINVEIGPSSKLQTNVPGDQVLTGTGNTPPTPNILQTFDDLIAAVQSNNVAAIQTGAQNLENGADQITNVASDVASRLIRLNNASTMNTNTQNTLESIAGNIQNVDMAKLGVELTQQQTAYQASLSATAKISQMSLLDYLT